MGSWKLLAAAAALLPLFAAASAKPLPNDVLKIGSVTVSNVGTPPIDIPEVTVAAIPPKTNPACNDGRFVFGSGQNIYLQPPDGSPGKSLVVTPTASLAPPGTPISGMPLIIDDNQIVAMPDGSLIYSVEGATAGPLRNEPSWWNETVGFPPKSSEPPKPGPGIDGVRGPGLRGAIFLLTSTDCGATWTQSMPNIDPATLRVPDPYHPGPNNLLPQTMGLCAHPRLRVNQMPGGTWQHSEFGGPDGHTLFADPYTGILYVSTSCTYSDDTHHPSDANNSADATDSNVGIAVALLPHGLPDSDAWHVVGYYPKHGFWRQAWTSLPAGNGTPSMPDVEPIVMSVTTIQPWSFNLRTAAGLAAADDMAKSNPIDLSAAPGQSGLNNNPLVKDFAYGGQDIATQQSLGPSSYVTLARSVGTIVNAEGNSENVLVSVPVTVGKQDASTYDGDADSTSKAFHQGFKVYRANAAPNGQLVNAQEVFLARPQNPAGNLYHATLIEGPIEANVQMYYWLEQVADDTSPDPSLADHFTLRYMLFVNGLPYGPVQDLALQGGKLYSWPYTISTGFLGDYLSGSSSYDKANNAVVFVASWTEARHLRLATVTVKLATPMIRKLPPWNRSPIYADVRFNPTHAVPDFSWTPPGAHPVVVSREGVAPPSHRDCEKGKCMDATQQR